MIICDLVSLVLFASIAISAWLGVLTVAQLLLVAMLAGLVSVFFKAAFQAYIPLLLKKDELVDGNAKLQASAAFATVSGPGIGGAVAQFLGIATVSCSMPPALPCQRFACLQRLPTNRTQGHRGPSESSRKEIRDGLRFLLHDPYLLPLAAFTATLGLGISSTDSLMIVFYIRTVGVTSSVTGIILGLLGAGGLFGAVISARLVRRYGSARAMLICRILLCFRTSVPAYHSRRRPDI